jgi:drug/metabolite transporter (DMT)-like permease
LRRQWWRQFSVSLTSRLFGIKTRKLEWLGIAIRMAGIILLNSGGNLSGNPWGALLILMGSMSWAFGSVCSSRIELPSGMMAGAIEMVTAGIVLLAASMLSGEADRPARHLRLPGGGLSDNFRLGDCD